MAVERDISAEVIFVWLICNALSIPTTNLGVGNRNGLRACLHRKERRAFSRWQ
jgi:hypothetical protein